MAEYDDRDEEENQHHRTASKIWQNVLSGVGELSNAAGDESVPRQLSRCYSARTKAVKRSLNPVFNEEFRFEVADDTLLQVMQLTY